MEFIGKQDKQVIVVSGYRVCNQKFDAASNTTTAQQIRLLQQNGHAHPNPRNEFITDLIHQINHWHRDGKEVILCIDANEPIDDPKSEISRLFTETDLVDLHHHRYPSLRKPATHQRGSQAIDLMAGSPLAATATTAAWIHPFGDPGSIKGDHRMSGIDFNPDILFGTPAISTHTMPRRGVHSRHDQTVNKFRTHTVMKCNQENLALHLHTLLQKPTMIQSDYTELEAIDQCLTKYSSRPIEHAFLPMLLHGHRH